MCNSPSPKHSRVLPSSCRFKGIFKGGFDGLGTILFHSFAKWSQMAQTLRRAKGPLKGFKPFHARLCCIQLFSFGITGTFLSSTLEVTVRRISKNNREIETSSAPSARSKFECQFYLKHQLQKLCRRRALWAGSTYSSFSCWQSRNSVRDGRWVLIDEFLALDFQKSKMENLLVEGHTCSC